MTLVILTIVVVALLVAALAIFLFTIGVQLNRTADNLDDCAQNVKHIAYQAKAIGPAIERINETGGTVIGALPLLCDAAERIGVAKSAPYVDPSEAPAPVYAAAPSEAPAPAHAAVHSEAPAPVYAAAPSEAPAPAHAAAPSEAPAAASSRSVGYLDDGDEPRGSLGYLDA